MHDLMTEALQNQTTPIAFNLATWPKNMNRPKSTRDGRDLILASQLSGGDQDTEGQMLYALPEW